MLKNLHKPINNKRGIGVIDLIVKFLFIWISAYLIVYMFLAMNHEAITRKTDSVASSMLDMISENREVNNDVINHYCDDIDRMSFYYSKYEIRIIPYSVQSGSLVEGSKLTIKSNNGSHNSIAKTNYTKGTIVRVEIISDEDTPLTRISKIMLSTSKARVVGYAEGGVE